MHHKRRELVLLGAVGTGSERFEDSAEREHPRSIPRIVLEMEESEPPLPWGREASKINKRRLIKIGALVFASLYILRLIVEYTSDLPFDPKIYISQTRLGSLLNTNTFTPTASFIQREDFPTSSPTPTIFPLLPPSELSEKVESCMLICSGKALSDVKERTNLTFGHFESELDLALGQVSPVSHLYPQDFLYEVRDTDQFSLASIISLRSRILSFPNPPTLPDDADFLLIDVDTHALGRCILCARREYLPTPTHHQQIVLEVVKWLRDTIEYLRDRRSYPSLILTLGFIDHLYEGNILNQEMEDLMKESVVVLGIEREPWFAPNRPQNGFLLRQQLSETLSSHVKANDSRVFLWISHPGTHRYEFLPAIHNAMLNSTFCLEPPGDSPTRRGFFEALLLGCIPVVFRRGTYDKIFPSTLGTDFSWDEGVALYVSETNVVRGEIDIVEHLAAISEREVRRRQMEIAGLLERIQYFSPRFHSSEGEMKTEEETNWPDDAFGLMLRELALIKRVGGDKT
ncbi:hypothetical protein T439DRAFT_351134 [Meredithblackwellia eburnea MCA 4105]